MDKRYSSLLFLLSVPVANAAIADSTENFVQGAVAGFFNSLVVSEISSWMDILLFVILPFLGMYGLTLYLTTKALQMAEDNFANNDSYGSSDLSDQAKRSSQLISVGISAVAVSQFGGFTPVISLVLGLIAAAFLINNFYGAASVTRHSSESSSSNTVVNNVDQTLEQVSTEEEEVDELEEDIERGEQGGADDEKDVEQMAREAARAIEDIEQIEKLLKKTADLERKDLDSLEDHLEELEGFKEQEAEKMKEIDSKMHETDEVLTTLHEKVETDETVVVDSIKDAAKEVKEGFNSIRDMLDTIEQKEEEELSQLNGDTEEFKNLLIEDEKFYHALLNLKNELTILEDQEADLEDLVKQIQDQEMMAEVRQMEERTQSLQQQLGELQTAEKDIRKLRQKIVQLDEASIDIEDQELKIIDDLGDEEHRVHSILEDLRKHVSRENSTVGEVLNTENIDSFEKQVERINSMTGQLEQMEKKEEEREREMEQAEQTEEERQQEEREESEDQPAHEQFSGNFINETGPWRDYTRENGYTTRYRKKGASGWEMTPVTKIEQLRAADEFELKEDWAWKHFEDYNGAGWKIHIAADPETKEDAASVAEILLPFLNQNGVYHKISVTMTEFRSHSKGEDVYGKLFTVYPRSDQNSGYNINNTEQIIQGIAGELSSNGMLSGGPPLRKSGSRDEKRVVIDGTATRIHVRWAIGDPPQEDASISLNLTDP